MNRIINLDKIGLFTNKSIEIFPLTVLTGMNGSGKSTILKAIENSYNNTKHYKWTGLSIFSDNFNSEITEGTILIFEQPEVGLHPKIQLILADLLLSYVQHGNIVIIETHSDHIINRLTRRYMESDYVRNILKIYFLERHELSTVTNIKIDCVDGCISEKQDFFYQFGDETEKIIDVGYRNLQNNSICANIKTIKIDEYKGIYDPQHNFFSESCEELEEIINAGLSNMLNKCKQ